MVVAVLAGLPDEYNTVATVLEMRANGSDHLDLDMAKKALMDEEQKLQRATSYTSVAEHGHVSALMVSSGKPFGGRRCWECGKIGHLKKDCKLKHERAKAMLATDRALKYVPCL